MSARTPHNDFKTPAAESFRHDRVGARAIKHQTVMNGVFPARRGKNVAHATQIALAFFTHIADKQKRKRVAKPPRLQDRRDSQYGGDSGSIV